MSVKGYTNTPSDKPPDYYSVDSSEVISQSRATRSSKTTKLYEYSPTKKALRRLSGKLKKLSFKSPDNKDTAKHKRLSSTLCLKKNNNDIIVAFYAHYNFNVHLPILVIFCTDVAE